MLLLELLVLLDEGIDAVYHALHQLHLGVAQPVLVGDVIGYTCNESRYSLISRNIRLVQAFKFIFG